MRTLEISEQKWEKFCRQVDAICHSGLITIQMEDPEGAKKTIAADLPLRSFGLDTKSDPCNTNIVIEAGLPNAKPMLHKVIEPIHVRLANDRDERRYNQLQIIAENGTTLVDLHPGLSAAELKKLEVKMPTRGKRIMTRGIRRGNSIVVGEKLAVTPRRSRAVSSQESKSRVSSTADAKNRFQRAGELAMKRALRDVDVEYRQGNLGRSRR